MAQGGTEGFLIARPWQLRGGDAGAGGRVFAAHNVTHFPLGRLTATNTYSSGCRAHEGGALKFYLAFGLRPVLLDVIKGARRKRPFVFAVRVMSSFEILKLPTLILLAAWNADGKPRTRTLTLRH